MLQPQFHHSVKVPRLYKVASTVAKNFDEGKGSLKQLVFQQKKHPNIKAIYSLVCTLFKKNIELDRILKKSQFLTKEPRCDLWLAKILIVELLWGKGCLNGQSKPENTVKAYEQIFKAHLSDEKQDWYDNSTNQEVSKPRYVRVNTLLTTLEETIESFENEGWELLEINDKMDYQGFLEKVKLLTERTFLMDLHIPNLLIFPPKTEFYNHSKYKKGEIILQDKASCLPVHILNPPTGSVVLDMCAAPGMKTTHLAEKLENTGTVYAIERDPRRFEILNNIINSSGASCVRTFNKDVLTCYKEEFPGLEYILVDPSCSGSGMTDRNDFENKTDIHRLEKLAGFQIKILRSALTRYPSVQRVVYSTCSMYIEENEDVVRQVLETNYNFKLVPAKKYLNDAWENVGSSDFGDIGKFCLYAKPDKDYTNGFFIAVFERLKDGDSNQFFNERIFNFKKDVQVKEHKRQKRERKEGSNNPMEQKYHKKKNKYCKETEHFINDGNDDNNSQNLMKESQDEVTVSQKKKAKRNKEPVDNIELNSDYKQTKQKTQFNESIEQSTKNVEFAEENIGGDLSKKPKHKKKLKEKTEQIVNNSDKILDQINAIVDSNLISERTEIKTKLKKKKRDKTVDINVENDESNSGEHKHKRKKDKHISDQFDNLKDSFDTQELGEEVKPKKRKKNKTSDSADSIILLVTDEQIVNTVDNEYITIKTKKERKIDECYENLEDISYTNAIQESQIKIKTKKKPTGSTRDNLTADTYTDDQETRMKTKRKKEKQHIYNDLVKTESNDMKKVKQNKDNKDNLIGSFNEELDTTDRTMENDVDGNKISLKTKHKKKKLNI